jgi:hypothetical protein
MTRSSILHSQVGCLPTCSEVTDDEVDALAHYAWLEDGQRYGDELVNLLRKLAPDHPDLTRMDRRARDNGYTRAGSDERLPDEEWAAMLRVQESGDV